MDKQCQRKSSGARTSVGPFSVLSCEDGASLTLGRRLASGEARSRGFTAEHTAKARGSKLGAGWEAWSKPGSPRWFVRRLPRNAYDPSRADATYTVLGPAEEVMARFVTTDAVPALMRHARGEASVIDDRDGNLVIAGTDGADATLDMLEDRLGDYEAEHVVAPGVVGYFMDSGNPGRALTLGQLDYDPAANYLDPRDERAIEALAPGESHQPRPADPEEGPVWGVVTRLSAAMQPKALMRGGVVLGMGFDEAQARADATERSPTDAEAADVETVDGSLAALSGWHDDDLRERVYFAPDGTVRRIDVFDVLPHHEGTPADPRWYTDDGAESDVEPAPAPHDGPDADHRLVCQHADCGRAIRPAGTFNHIALDGGRDREQDADHTARPALFADISARGVSQSAFLCFTTPDLADVFITRAGERGWSTERQAVTTYSLSSEEQAEAFITHARERGWSTERCGLAEEHMVTVYCPNAADGLALVNAIDPPPPGFVGEEVADAWVTVYCPDVTEALALARAVEGV